MTASLAWIGLQFGVQMVRAVGKVGVVPDGREHGGRLYPPGMLRGLARSAIAFPGHIVGSRLNSGWVVPRAQWQESDHGENGTDS